MIFGKRKKVIVFTIISTILILCVVYFSFFNSKTYKPENVAIFKPEGPASFINGYNLDEFIELYIEISSPAKKKKTNPLSEQIKIFKSDCIIETNKEDAKVIETPEEFLVNLSRLKFSIFVDEIILNEPFADIQENQAFVTIKSFWDTKEEKHVLISKLIIEIINNELRIVSLIRTFEEPSSEDLLCYQKIKTNQDYNPRKGLGRRYLLGGNYFSRPAVNNKGNLIYFASLRNRSADLYIHNVDENKQIQLTNTDHWDTDILLTPNEKQIIFYSDRLSYFGDYFIMDLDGNNKRLWVNRSVVRRSISFAHDGSSTVFVTKQNDIYSINTANPDGSKIRLLYEDKREIISPVFSKDKNKIFFSMIWFDRSIMPPRIVEIFSINADGTNLTRLTEDKALKTLITCNNSNQYLFYTRENDKYKSELWFIDIVSLIAKPVQSVLNWVIWEPKVSIDGKYLCFAYDKKPFRYDIYVIDISKPDQNLSVSRLTNTNGLIQGYSPSNNANWVVFVWEPKGGHKRGKGDIYLLNRESKVLQNLGKNH